MSPWGPGAIPPGYTIAADGSLVPLQPQGQMPYYPAPQPAVSISVMVMGPSPMPMGPMGPVMPAYPMAPMPPMLAAPLPAALPTLPIGPHLLAPPQAYAPGWSGQTDPSLASEMGALSAPSSHGSSYNSQYKQQSSSEIVLAGEGRDNAREFVQQRPPTGSEARYYGAMSLATSGVILATAFATVSFFIVPVGAVLASAAVASAITGSMGFWLLRQGKKSKHEVNLHPDLQVQIMNFAARKDGRLTVTSLAQGLSWTLDEADQALKEMSSSHYVDVELDADHGVVTYVFRELVKKPLALPAKTENSVEQK